MLVSKKFLQRLIIEKNTQNNGFPSTKNASSNLIIGFNKPLRVSQMDDMIRCWYFQATISAIIEDIREMASYSPWFQQQLMAIPIPRQVTEDPVVLCDLVGAIMANASTQDLQELMEETDVRDRFGKFIYLMENF